MRTAWFKQQMGAAEYWRALDRWSGLPRQVAEIAKSYGMLRVPDFDAIFYLQQCRAAGVPIPPNWGDSRWGKPVGNLTIKFVKQPERAIAYRYNNPEGTCVALTRNKEGEDQYSFIDIICLGHNSFNACFFEREGDRLDAKPSIAEFGTPYTIYEPCTECHAGENPFIVHPGTVIDDPANRSPEWYRPIVPSAWPQNPGPLTLLEQVPINALPPDNDRSCLECHVQSIAGRFPHIRSERSVPHSPAPVSHRPGSAAPGTAQLRISASP